MFRTRSEYKILINTRSSPNTSRLLREERHRLDRGVRQHEAGLPAARGKRRCIWTADFQKKSAKAIFISSQFVSTLSKQSSFSKKFLVNKDVEVVIQSG